MLSLKIIEKLLKLKRALTLKGGGDKHALLSYVLIPPPALKLDFYYLNMHNSRLMCLLMAKTLNKLGYTVHLYDYLDENIDRGIAYNLFIGHNITFSRLAAKLPERCRKILLTTGSSPAYDNQQLRLRQENLEQRKGIKVKLYRPIDYSEYAEDNFKVADDIYMIGTEVIKQTWFPQYRYKIKLYNNVSLIKPRIKSGFSGGFLFISSVGQLRRGLDLVLDCFAGRPEKIYVRAPFDWEPDFARVYARELHKTRNIIPLSFLKYGSQQYNKLVNDVDFVILPSASEGQSGSVINLMLSGVLPIVTDNVGLDNVERYGFRIEVGTLASVDQAVERASRIGPRELSEKRQVLYETVKSFSPESFAGDFERFIHERTEGVRK